MIILLTILNNQQHMKDNKIIITNDGSHSIYSSKFKESYHSLNGSISESLHVFIKNGLKTVYKENINILEIGFGTGLNVLLTIIENKKKKLNFHTIEKYPITKEIYEKLNYSEKLKIKENILIDLHEKSWNQPHDINRHFTFYKHLVSVQKLSINLRFDIIYYDAFSPRKDNEMWSYKILTKMFNLLQYNGFLVTYCAQGEVKRILKKIGFKVETLKGPLSKREMVKAIRI